MRFLAKLQFASIAAALTTVLLWWPRRYNNKSKSHSSDAEPSTATLAAGVESLNLLRKQWKKGGKHFRPFCPQSQFDDCIRAPYSCILQQLPKRWHIATQELLIRHLRRLWPGDEPRTMVDIGSQAGHGPFRNTSDALLWLQHFHAAGSVVVGVDAFLDYALDLQHRFDHVEPYASMRGVTRQSLHAAIGTPWGCKSNASTSGDLFSSGEGCLFNLDLVAAFTNLYCSRTDWKDFFFTIERAGGISDHSCRITRQRAGISPSTLPTPPSPYTFNTNEEGATSDGELPPGPRRYRVPSRTLVDLWRSEPLHWRHIDFLKIDVDIGWHRLGEYLAPLVSARAFSVLVMEVDNKDTPMWRTIEQFNCLLHAHGYLVYFKMPCSGEPAWSQRHKYVPLSGENHTLFPPKWGSCNTGPGCVQRLSCEEGNSVCTIQDLMAIDASKPELRKLVELGEAECTDEVKAATALTRELPLPAVGASKLTMEETMPKPWLLQRRPKELAAKCLADGSWSCGRQPPKKGAPKCSEQQSVSCAELWK